VKTLSILFLLFGTSAAYAQVSNSRILFSSSPNYTIPPALPACDHVYTYSQTAQYNWTEYCVSGQTWTVVNGGTSSGTGTGGCYAPFGYCLINGSPAPQFSGQYAPDGSGNYNIWLNVSSNSVNVSIPVPFPACQPPTASQGDVSTIPVPTCPTVIACKFGPTCGTGSPIVIDPTGEGFFLTSKAHGVEFRRDPGDNLQQMSWTDPAHHNAWLVRPNADGSVTDLATNMFGNLSPQPESDTPNGYAALAYMALNEGCGKIAKLDPKSCPGVWSQLRLWHDSNQDGMAQPEELSTLDAAGVDGLSLEPHEKDFTDEYGNQFRFESQTFDDNGTGNYRSYDVWLLL
jgi:hypothetical protein